MQLNLTFNLTLMRSSVEHRCKRRIEFVKVVPSPRYSDGLRALFRDDQVVMQPTRITLPTLPSLPYLPSFLSSAYSSLFGLKRPSQTIPFLSYPK